METKILRVIKDSGRMESLLESLVRSLGFLPENAVRLFDEELLPGPLERLVKVSEKKAWCCWQLADRIWFYMAEMSLDQSRTRGRVVMRATSFDPEGHI